MVAVLVGILLIGAGLVGVTNAFRLVDSAAEHWPREATRGDVANFVVSNFLIRVLSLLLVACGIALIWSRL